MTYFKEIGQGCEIVVSHAPKIPPQGWRGYWTLVVLGQRFPRANPPHPQQIPLRDLCDLGGWKDPDTVVKCYQASDEEDLRKAIQARRTGQAGA